MKTAKELLEIAAQSNITVLLQGESGTGKELAARKLHDSSPRRRGPFVALNCGAIAKNLIESTLEGATKGAFTGATADRQGVVRAAHGGTLFLDEIGELPYECQSRLLRILQEHTVMPLGSTQNIPVDFRLVCATNRNLKNEVAQGTFREDLFFRLNAFPIQLQPLREREDFCELAQELWHEISHDVQHRDTTAHLPNAADTHLTDAEVATLHFYNWPGNIRQLKIVLQRYTLLRPHGITLSEILADEYSTATPAHTDPPAYVAESAHTANNAIIAESARTPPWNIIESTLQKTGGNKQRAARVLGISRTNLYLQIKKAATMSRAV